MSGSYQEIICPVCGKRFIRKPESIYKIKEGNKIKQVCSYKCWRKLGYGDGKKIIC